MEVQTPSTIILYIFAGTGIIALFLLFFIAFFAFYKKRLTQKEKQVLQLENDYRFNLIKKTIETQESEKIRLAKDLHDEIGSMLTLLKYAINQLESEIPDHSKTQNAHQVLDKIMLDFKSVCRDLIPSSIKNFGLLVTLKEVVDTTQANSPIQFSIAGTDTPLQLSLEKELSIYRLFKEVLNNIVKHAQAQHVHIGFHAHEQHLHISFIYDGKGITDEEIQKIKFNTNSIGIQSIDTRLLALGGHIHYLKEEPDYFIKIKVPL